ncbi:MAG: FAD-binding oxidoreductase [Ahrensia sp.]|nr:FAD-binding oxidoreductase [Ahrensia sp.]
MISSGWGRLPGPQQHLIDIEAALARRKGRTHLYRGMGRSYGDVALNSDGVLAETRNHSAILSADWRKGRIIVQSGVTLGEVLAQTVPKGWFLPVVPGTRFVSIGGAVANDVHGKNHHKVGSFGHSVTEIGLRRSDGGEDPIRLKPGETLFNLTIAGLGLTGFVDWVGLQLTPITSSLMDVENTPFATLEEFVAFSEAESDWPYSVAWIDCFSLKGNRLKGIFTRARHAQLDGPIEVGPSEPKISLPLSLPDFFLNRRSVSAFNRLYAARPASSYCGTQAYSPFLFPLDSVAHWNRLYGRRGFFQHQSLVPLATAQSAIGELLEAITHSGQGSFLAVLKRYGPEHSPGIMTFGGEGYSLALDIANRGECSLRLMKRLEDIAVSHGGRLYPAKDATMSEASFKTRYPRWQELEDARDPLINSDFWRRVVPEAR